MRHFARYAMLGLICAIGGLVAGVGMATTPLDAYPAVYTTPLAIPASDSAPAFTSAEQLCIQRTVYGEARGEPFAAQVAVAASMVTRSLSGAFPSDICKVATQPGQYNGYNSTTTLRNEADARSWQTASAAVEVATMTYGSLPATYREVTYFDSGKVKTTWSADRRVIGRLGTLIFYGKRTSA